MRFHVGFHSRRNFSGFEKNPVIRPIAVAALRQTQSRLSGGIWRKADIELYQRRIS